MADDRVVRGPPHRADRAGDLAAQRMLPVQQLVEHGEDMIRRRVDVHPDLVDDDRLLGREVGAAQHRPQGELAHRLERDIDPRGWHLRAVDRQLAVGAGVHAAPDALDALRQRPRIRMAACSLEDEVLEDVGEAGVRLVLVPRPDRDEQRDDARAGGGHGLGDDAQAARQDGALVRRRRGAAGARDGRGHAPSSSSSERSPSAPSVSADMRSSIWMKRRSRASSSALRGSGPAGRARRVVEVRVEAELRRAGRRRTRARHARRRRRGRTRAGRHGSCRTGGSRTSRG